MNDYIQHKSDRNDFRSGAQGGIVFEKEVSVNSTNEKEFIKMSVFLTIKETATRSGLSQFYIRNQCKDGTIPHRMMGIKYMVDYEAFIEREHRLAAQSVAHQ